MVREQVQPWPFGQNLPLVPESAAVAETFGTLHMLFERVLVAALLLAQVEGGATLSELAEGMEVELVSEEAATRTQPGLDAALRRELDVAFETEGEFHRRGGVVLPAAEGPPAPWPQPRRPLRVSARGPNRAWMRATVASSSCARLVLRAITGSHP